MLQTYLESNFCPGEPIISSDISIDISDNYKRLQLKRLTDEGIIIRLEPGIYCIPKKSKLGNLLLLPSADEIVEKKYIRRNGEVFGYYSGILFANILGLTNQMPFCIEITSNNTKNNLRKIKIQNRPFIIRSSPITITNNNFEVLQIIDLLSTIDKFREIPIVDAAKKIQNYIKSKSIKRKDFDSLLPFFNDKVYKNIYEMRISDVLA